MTKFNNASSRIAIGIEYEGTHFKGFQKQKNLSQTIQGQLEKALSKIADEKINTICSGRTDTGVHAYSQVIHFDTSKTRELEAWIKGGNSFLPKDIRILWAKEVDKEFHARFSAHSRTYRYLLRISKLPSALWDERSLWISEDLDINAIRRSSKLLIGEHDFSSFRSSACQSKTPFRNVKSIVIKKNKELVSIEITANAFLQNMVRIIVGTFLLVGKKEIFHSDIKAILEGKNRNLAGKTASPSGLYFVGPSYKKKFMIPDISNTLT